MCGIAGIYNLNGELASVLLLQRMMDVLHHRGPDDEGHYLDSSLALGHQRLSILDLTPAGHQPMSNENSTLWLVFNGEIYNYKTLRSQLQDRGHVFQSQTDTEVILHAYEEYGSECLKLFNGMWAFALWDSRQKKLFCARDRLGIKPFYYYQDNRRFLFASEIKAILCDRSVPRRPNDRVICQYLAYDRLDHREETFFAGIKQLSPAHYMTVEDGQVKISRYWDLDPTYTLDGISDAEATLRFREILEDSVRLQLQSDVPLGTCLSGGLDSSSIVCIVNDLLRAGDTGLQGPINERQKTFSSCFEDRRFDEREFIEAVVAQTHVEPHYVFPQGVDQFNEMSRFLWHQEQPVAGTSQYAQWCVMRLVREQGVTVVLDGQGGDELLAGYHLFFPSYLKELFSKFHWSFFFQEVNELSRHFGYNYTWKRIAMELFKPLFPKPALRWRRRLLGRSDFQDSLTWLNQDFVTVNPTDDGFPHKYSGHLTQHLYRFLVSDRLPSLLRYEDRSSMAFSVEARVPFLDYRLVEFIFALPNEQKIREGTTKVVLRNAMKGVVPDKVRGRMDKMGFVTPQAIWFRDVCRDPINEIICSTSFRQRGYFDPPRVQERFARFCAGQENESEVFWRCINLELWLRMFLD